MIAQKGLINPFLSTSPSSAKHWAVGYGDEAACVLEVTVDTHRLIPDLNQDSDDEILSQMGLEHHDIRGEDLEFYLDLVHKYGIPWNSIPDSGGGYAAVYVGIVPVNQIDFSECEEKDDEWTEMTESMAPDDALRVFRRYNVDARGMDREALRKARSRINMQHKVHPERGGSHDAMQELNMAVDALADQPQGRPQKPQAGFQDFNDHMAGQGKAPPKKPGFEPFRPTQVYRDVKRGPRPTKTYRGSA